ncbi:hypothetical protein [Endozoicomonas sp. ALB115]|uniref:hypothetical protein n=1 Tax=Endozoicomonas sp. ALB115 TaxID=3403074 RepID=UPI003BB65D12
MAIKSDAFGKTELSGVDGKRFLEQLLVERKSNPNAKASYARAKKRFSGFKKSLSTGA